MPQTSNEYEISLLYSNPHALIVHYQKLVAVIVKRYANLGSLEKNQIEDHIQNVNVKLLKSISTIQKNYKGTALLSTYFSVVISNICKEMYLDNKQNIDTVEFEDALHDEKQTLENNLIFTDEINRLKKILITYDKRMNKIVFALKLTFRIPLQEEDIVRCFSAAAKTEIRDVLSQFKDRYGSMTDPEAFGAVKFLFNKYEKKNTQEGSLQRWTNRMIDEIITLLNGNPPKRTYTKESFALLFEKYLETLN